MLASSNLKERGVNVRSVEDMMKRKIQIFIAILLCTIIPILWGANTGSTTNLGAQALVTYNSSPNTVNPGALMNAGFTLNPGAALTWNSFFPVLGPVTMNGGNLTLDIDFLMGGNATLVNGGIFTANLSAITFPYRSTPFTIGTSPSTFDTANIKFNSTINLSTSLIFKSTTGVNTLNANGNVINFLSGGAIQVASGATLTIQNAVLQGISGNQLFCQDNAGILSLQNVTVIQDGSYSFTLGILNIINDVEITGSNVFAFRSTNSLNIASDSTLFFDLGSTFSYDTTNASLLKFADSTSELFLHGATLYATGTGIDLTSGTLNIDQNSFFASTGTLGVSIGNCAAATDCVVNMLPNAQLTVNQGVLSYRNVNASSFNMFNAQTLLSMSTGTTLNLYRSLTGQGNVMFGNNVTFGTGPTATLGINSFQLGTITITALSAC